jgi:CPA1 family monovalent cation:H+ antiporter
VGIEILFAIVLSNVLNNVLPKLPLTLIQIAFGCVLGLTIMETSLQLDPEIFMVLMIAPLLYREAEETDLSSLWHVKKQVLLMAFLLVIITVIVVGFSVHWLIPAIPVAACFALGAILGPTDVVAVSSLSTNLHIDQKLMDVLLGEGLINDASGVTTFHFAVAALLTGTFSAISAMGELFRVAIGGLLVGYILISVKRIVTNSLQKISVKSMATYVLIELLMPFLCYLVAELFGFSGVLAAVLAGSRQALDLKKSGLFEAELTTSTHTLWDIITFTLNSLVFLLLGLQLPSVVSHIWFNTEYSHSFLILASAVVTGILFVVRFFSVFFIAKDVLGSTLKRKLKSALILTLSGVKGAVSLATAFALPFVYANGESFVERPLILFITGGTIIMSLLLALIALPLVTDPFTMTQDTETPLRLAILEETVAQLLSFDAEDQMKMVIAQYRRRIWDLRHNEYTRKQKRDLRAVHNFAYSLEVGAIRRRFASHSINRQTYLDYLDLISIMYHKTIRGAVVHLISRCIRLYWVVKRFVLPTGRTPLHKWLKVHRKNLQTTFSDNTDLIIRSLSEAGEQFPMECIQQVMEERIDLNRQVNDGLYDVLHSRVHQNYDTALLNGYYVERRVIHQFLDEKKISKEQANIFRVDVNNLESFTLAHSKSELVLKFLALTDLH